MGNPLFSTVGGASSAAVFLDKSDKASVNNNQFKGFLAGVQAFDSGASTQTYTTVNGNYVDNANLFVVSGSRTFGVGCKRIGNTGTGYYFDIYDMLADVRDIRNTGSPEGVYAAGVGSLYHRTNGGANTTLYVKESGTGNTGWVVK